MSPAHKETGKPTRRAPVLLLLGPPGDAEPLLQQLGGFSLVAAESPAAAEEALRAGPIDAAVVSAGAPTGWIDRLLQAVARERPGLPVLAVRRRHAEEPPQWRARGVGVLREPLLEGALARSASALAGLPRG